MSDLPGKRDCADVIDELYPEPGDLIIQKFGYGAFHGTPLADLLRGLQSTPWRSPAR